MIGIVCAMDDEVRLLTAALEGAAETRVGGFQFTSGRLEGVEAVLLRCGIGKVNAAVGCGLLLDRFKPDLVINSGSAGGIREDLTFGDVVVSEGLLYHDVDVRAFGYADGQIPGQPAVFPVPSDLVRLAEGAIDSLVAEGVLPRSLRHTRGLIGSGDTFMHEPLRIAELRARFPRVCAVEMEGAAVAHACALFGVPVLVIRALSDVAGAESPMKFDEFLPLASRNSSAIVRRVVKER